jgi:uncharacterized lipoprotein
MKLIYIPVALVFCQLTACSYFFPDKEKDYIYSQEISALEIPPELQADKKLVAKIQRDDSQSLAYEVVFVTDPELTFIRINSSFAHVWRIAGKALTELPLEITDKNREKALYYVQYDPDLKDADKDGSYWQELVFMFGSDIHQELPYQIFLEPSEKGVRILVRDENANTLSDGLGLQLLRLIFDTINNDLAKKDGNT